VRVVGVGHPVIRPLRIFLLRLRQRVVPQRHRVRVPAQRHNRISRGCRQRIQFGLRGWLGVVERVDVDKDRADDPGPLLAGGDVHARAGVVVAADPVVEDDRLGVVVVAEVVVELQLGRPAAQVLNGRIDEPDADVVLGAGPAVGGRTVLHAGVAVLVLDRVLVDALRHDALLFGVDDDAGAPVRRRGLQHVAVLVHGDPVEGLVEARDVAALRTHAARTIRGRMGEDGVDIDAAVAAAKGVADLHVVVGAAAGRAAAQHGLAAGDALDGYLGARAAVGRRVDGDGIGQLRRVLRGLLPIAAVAAHHLNAVVDQRRHRSAALADGRLHNTVVQSPRGAIVNNSYGSARFEAGTTR
jgi:hypothetical protein